ncbi:type II secretion system F family protein [Thermaurantiacus sp.]
MTALPLPALSLLVALLLTAAVVAAMAAVQQGLARAGLVARARRACAQHGKPGPTRQARLERETVDETRLVFRVAALCGLLAPGERMPPRLRLVLFALVVFAFAFLLARVGLAAPATVALALFFAAGGFRWHRWRQEAAMARAFEAQLPDTIGLMVRCVRAGIPVAEAVAEAGSEMAAPAGPLFAAADRQIRLGRPLEQALWDIAATVRLAEFNFLCVAVAVQRETGGNLAETLAALETTVRKRLALRLKVRALTSEARASALIIGALPLLMAVGLAFLAPDYLTPLLVTDPGRLLLATAVGALGLGGAIMSHLVRRETAAP